MQGKRIAVLTLNPGIDRMIYPDAPMTLGGHNRSRKAIVDQGSKGANQALMLKGLGADPDYFAFTGGVYGSLSEKMMESAGVRSHFVSTECGVRLNIKIIEPDGRGTELNEAGGPVSEAEFNELKRLLFEERFDIVSMCGSFPQGVENDVYNSLITDAKKSGAITVLDTSKEALRLGAQACPYIIKPNRSELTAFGCEAPMTWKTALFECGKVYEKYGCRVLCTLDSEGSVYYGDEGAYRIKTTPQRADGFVGAGDAYLSSFIYARLIEGLGVEESLRFGAAAAAAKIALEGTKMPKREAVESAKRLVDVEKLA